MYAQLVDIFKKCDRKRSWNNEEINSILKRCLEKENYCVRLCGTEICSFACWVFLNDYRQQDGLYVEQDNGKIAYIVCAFNKSGNGELLEMLQEGLQRHPNVTELFWHNDKKDEDIKFKIRRK